MKIIGIAIAVTIGILGFIIYIGGIDQGISTSKRLFERLPKVHRDEDKKIKELQIKLNERYGQESHRNGGNGNGNGNPKRETRLSNLFFVKIYNEQQPLETSSGGNLLFQPTPRPTLPLVDLLYLELIRRKLSDGDLSTAVIGLWPGDQFDADDLTYEHALIEDNERSAGQKLRARGNYSTDVDAYTRNVQHWMGRQWTKVTIKDLTEVGSVPIDDELFKALHLATDKDRLVELSGFIAETRTTGGASPAGSNGTWSQLRLSRRFKRRYEFYGDAVKKLVNDLLATRQFAEILRPNAQHDGTNLIPPEYISLTWEREFAKTLIDTCLASMTQKWCGRTIGYGRHFTPLPVNLKENPICLHGDNADQLKRLALSELACVEWVADIIMMSRVESNRLSIPSEYEKDFESRDVRSRIQRKCDLLIKFASDESSESTNGMK